MYNLPRTKFDNQRYPPKSEFPQVQAVQIAVQVAKPDARAASAAAEVHRPSTRPASAAWISGKRRAKMGNTMGKTKKDDGCLPTKIGI